MSLLCLSERRGKGPAYRVSDTGYATPCWLWQGSLNSKGYPLRGTRDGGLYLVHRQAFVEAGGVLEEGDEAHHLCEQRSCVNSEHIAARTPLQHRRTHHAPVARAILKALEEGVCQAGALRDVANGTGCRSESAGAAVTRMVRRGEIVRVRRGVYALPFDLQARTPGAVTPEAASPTGRAEA